VVRFPVANGRKVGPVELVAEMPHTVPDGLAFCTDGSLLVQAGSAGLVSCRLVGSGAPVPVDTIIVPASPRIEPTDRITPSDLPDGGSFLVMGDTGTGLWGHAMSETGGFGDVTQWVVASPWESGVTAVLAEEAFVFVAGADGPGITTLARNDAGRLAVVGETSGGRKFRCRR